MNKKGKLVLKDGSVFHGNLLGDKPAFGEVVFTTGVIGYQETLTDPSFCGQIVVMTYPLIGNYGINKEYNQADKSYFRGYVVGELCDHPSNWMSEGTIIDFLNEQKITCLYGVDTRAITRKIRDHGAMRGVIVPEDMPQDKVQELLDVKDTTALVQEVTKKQAEKFAGSGKKVAVLDFGAKRAMLRDLASYGYDMTVYPAFTSAKEILAGKPEGIFLSNGPGDPKDLPEVVETIKELVASGIPIFGICLGYQLVCLALGGDTYKMKFGHRGVNHPVKDLRLNKVVISSQNHGYAVEEKSLEGTGLFVTHRNVNDGTIEGVAHAQKPVFAVQYHPEAAPGPDGSVYLFEHFNEMIGGLVNA